MEKKIFSVLVLAMFLIMVGGVSAEGLPDCRSSLISYWNFDDGTGATAKDSAGGNDGIIYGASWTEGIVGGALSYDGDDYVQTPLSSNSLPLTIATWFKADVVTGERSIVDSDIAGHYGQSIILGYGDGDGTLDVQHHNGFYDSPFVPNPGVWYFAVATFNTGIIELYVNGNFVDSKTFNQGTLDGSNFRIGRHNPSDPQWFKGVIDEVAVFDRVLSADEVAALYETSSAGGGYCQPTQPTLEERVAALEAEVQAIDNEVGWLTAQVNEIWNWLEEHIPKGLQK